MVLVHCCAVRQVQNGLDKDRIDRLTGMTCRCGRGKCFGEFRKILDKLMQFLNIFWNLSKTFQDEYVNWPDFNSI